MKTAIFGCDPNWGRIVAAAGYSGADVDEKITLSFSGEKEEVFLIDSGRPLGNEEQARKLMETSEELVIKLRLEKGNGKALPLVAT